MDIPFFAGLRFPYDQIVMAGRKNNPGPYIG